MILAPQQLARLRGAVAMVDGGFDPLHAGHIAYFRQALALGLPLLVNGRGDEYITSAKTRANLLPELQRAELLDALEMVSYVHVCTTSTRDVLQQLVPAAYVKGSDWRGRLPSAEVETCTTLGVEIVFIESVTGSSTEVVADFLHRMEAITAQPVTTSGRARRHVHRSSSESRSSRPFTSSVAPLRVFALPLVSFSDIPKKHH